MGISWGSSCRNGWTAGLAIVSSASLLLAPPFLGATAWAQSASSGYVDASTVGTLPGQNLNCDTFCSGLVDPTNQDELGTTGNDGWTTNDDVYCADHGVATNPTVSANPNLTVNPDIPCNVPVLPGDQTCSSANENVLRCKVHGTQVESHCAAYQTDTGATSAEITLEEYDAAAAATCLTACMVKAPGLAGGLELACSAAGIFASTQELIKVLAMQSSTQKAIYGAASAVGLATSGVSAFGGISTLTSTSASGAKTNKGHKDACMAAFAMTALAGYRGYNIYTEDNAKSKECTNIQNLLSSSGVSLDGSTATVSSSSGSGSTIIAPSTSSSSSGSTVIAPTTSSSSGGSGTITTVIVPTSSAVTPSANTVSQAVPLTTGSGGAAPNVAMVGGQPPKPVQLAQTAAGLDGSILNGTGLGTAVAPIAQQVASNPASANMAAAGDAGGLIGSGFGSQGAPGAALANLARAAGQLAAAGEFPGGGAGNAVYATGGGAPGGGAPKAAADDDNPFAKLAAAAGNNGAEGGGAAPSNLGFDKAPDPCIDGADIWHTACHGTIFDVISGRINRSRNRVQQLPWVDPDRE